MSVTIPTPFTEGFYREFPVENLRESDDNPRYITPDAMDRLEHALREQPDMLNARPTICDEYGVVICGNMRLRTVKERLGWRTVPTYVHIFSSEAEKREWMLRDNQEYGDWVPDQLAAIVAAHVDEGADATLLGFGNDEIEALLRRATGEAIVPEPSEPPEPTLDSAVLVEIRATHEGFQQILPTLEQFNQVEGVEVAVSG